MFVIDRNLMPSISPVVRGEAFSLDSLIAWLETMPPDEEYDYGCNGYCLLGRYFRSLGYKRVCVGGITVNLDDELDINIPHAFGEIAVDEPRTFGSALTRARSYAEKVKG